MLIGLISLRGLHRRIEHLSETPHSEEKARRELLASAISTPTDVKIRAKIFWALGPDKVAPVEVELALSADPVKRAKQVLHELIANPPTADQHTLPTDTALLGFLHIAGTELRVADFFGGSYIPKPPREYSANKWP